MDKNTLNSSFGKWGSLINIQKLSEQVEHLKQDYLRLERICRWKSLIQALCHSIWRITNGLNPVPDDCPVLSDKMVYICTTQNRAESAFRLLEVADTKGNILRLITNRFDLGAEEISDIYRSRWGIELFFKWLKQHVEIKHFYGMSETAIQNQIYLALITYCLHVLIQLETKSKKSLLRISRWLKATLWKPAYIWLRRFEEQSSS